MASAFPNIDPRIKSVGVSKLRQLNSTELRALGETVLLFQENDEPLAVLMSYTHAVELSREARKETEESK